MMNGRFDCPPDLKKSTSVLSPIAQDLTFCHLEKAQGQAFSGMTFPAFEHLLSLEPQPKLLDSNHASVVYPAAIGVFDNHQPVALALLLLPGDEEQPDLVEVLSLFVAPSWRRQGLGSLLLRQTEMIMRQSGGLGLRVVYATGKSFQPIIERMMESCGWRPSFKRMHIFRCFVEAFYDTIKPFSRLRQGYDMVAWREVADAEAQALLRSDWVPRDLSPEVFARNCDADVSLALRYHGEFVGWILIHRFSEDSFRVSSAFVRPDVAQVAALVPLLVECARRALDAGYLKATFTTVAMHPKMTRFALRRFSPCCYFIGESRGAERHFVDE